MRSDNFTRATCILYTDLVETLNFLLRRLVEKVARVKLPNLISKFKFINTNQTSIHLFPVMLFYALRYEGVNVAHVKA